MSKTPHPNEEDIKDYVFQLTGTKIFGRVEIVYDTSDYMNIYQGNVLSIGGGEYFILGDVAEPRFGMQDQPKYWVKKTIDLDSGEIKLIKCVFHEEFIAHIGTIRIPCFRSPEKEAKVMELTIDDDRFMHGVSHKDVNGNNVRIIDWIYGVTLYNSIIESKLSHEEYFNTQFPGILKKLLGCFEAIQHLHDYGLCHGDIRNDHIIIEQDTDKFRWIDFDLTQRFSDYDEWSIGNVIQFCTGKGLMSFHSVRESGSFSDKIKNSLKEEDGAAFLKYRIMNLRKLYGYIPKRLNNILMRFSLDTKKFYDKVDQVIDDLSEVLEADFD